MMLDLDHFKMLNDRYGTQQRRCGAAAVRGCHQEKPPRHGRTVSKRRRGIAVILFGTSGEEAVIVAGKK
jgi:hypothetical protein